MIDMENGNINQKLKEILLRADLLEGVECIIYGEVKIMNEYRILVEPNSDEDELLKQLEISNKLQPGDYVTDLTEEHFDELISIEGHKVSLIYNTDFDFIVCCEMKPLLYLMNDDSPATNKLTFEEFLRRAKNTFK